MERLAAGALSLGVALDERALCRFALYLEELGRWNRRVNLTAARSDEEVVERHFLDSLTPLSLVGPAGRLLDVGSGGGFPGLPMKIARPGLDVTLVDSREKKVFFLRHVIRRLGLDGVEALACRVESDAFRRLHGHRYDCVISRAFSALDDFFRLAAPLAAPGGLVVAMKGPLGAELEAEIEEVSRRRGLAAAIREVAAPLAARRTTLVAWRIPRQSLSGRGR
ncbi:MAG TPA: 16S rRNA (guanine(527)-N(7))-methyltransferase RsmG [Deltaproteobacteria bacterium]|nr:16S rRNA (guanine(527)-N(7))-methyltransferase RsmG [Deltaproteobacteria bacterium]